MGKVDRELFRAKYGDDPIEYFKHLPNVESVEVCHDEIIVNYKLEKWAYQKASTRDTTLYLDRLDKYVEDTVMKGDAE